MEEAGNPAPENGPPVADADAAKAEKVGVWTGKNYPTAADFPDGNCRVREGSSLVANPADPAWKWVVDNCQFDKGVKVVLAADRTPKPLPKKKEAKQEAPVEPVQTEEVPQPSPILLASNDVPNAAEAAPAAAKTVESVGVDQAIGQMKSLIPAGQDASPALMVGGAALLAVVGAAIKLGPGLIKAAQEAKMKKLEIEEKKAEQGEENHAKCSAERAMLEVKLSEQANQISALSSKLSEVEKKASAKPESSIDLGDFDPEEMRERLEALEKALKKAAAPAKKPQGKKK